METTPPPVTHHRDAVEYGPATVTATRAYSESEADFLL